MITSFFPFRNHIRHIFNGIGKIILKNQNTESHHVEWDASGISSGIYYYMLEADDFQQVKKMRPIK